MNVYRVEYDGDEEWQRVGPYIRTGGLYEDTNSDMFEYEGAHPMPSRDDMSADPNDANIRFCFRTEAQLYSWFHLTGRRYLATLGYVIAVYEVAHAEHGGKQSAFYADDGHRVDTRPILREQETAA